MQRIEAIVSGRVQGVSFRVFTVQVASSLGLKGFVRNTNGDCVEVVAEGKKEPLEKLLAELQKGPPLSRVDKVDVVWKQSTNEFGKFQISY